MRGRRRRRARRPRRPRRPLRLDLNDVITCDVSWRTRGDAATVRGRPAKERTDRPLGGAGEGLVQAAEATESGENGDRRVDACACGTDRL